MVSWLRQLGGRFAAGNSAEPTRLRLEFWPDPTEEVSEHRGVLLVRLGRGSAMQVRLASDGAVYYRIVPIANVTLVEDDSSWQQASDAQVGVWMHDDSSIGLWLLAKGLRYDANSGQLAEAAAS
ncbi:MAG TPA: hypothetical protein VFW44_20830 [Bryobacteraceae bacterium]|nr:hypothetical protein [Bryobacteraceae bacterium]